MISIFWERLIITLLAYYFGYYVARMKSSVTVGLNVYADDEKNLNKMIDLFIERKIFITEREDGKWVLVKGEK